MTAITVVIAKSVSVMVGVQIADGQHGHSKTAIDDRTRLKKYKRRSYQCCNTDMSNARKVIHMLSQKITFVNSELKAKIDPDANTVTLEPNDRVRGFGVAIELAEAIQFAKLILEMEAHLQAEFDERFAECQNADDIGRDESLSPWR